jgi:hypothetical protein
MDTGWIQVFVLMLSECVAPEGKTVCQQNEFELQFLDRSDCELAHDQLVSLKDRTDNIIVEKNDSRCVPSARQRQIYANLADVKAALGDNDNWRPPPAEVQDGADTTREEHKKRLASLRTCEDTAGRQPCKVGDIIVEEDSAEKKIEVWRRDH